MSFMITQFWIEAFKAAQRWKYALSTFHASQNRARTNMTCVTFNECSQQGQMKSMR